MSAKRYQVFVSSTFADLQSERQKVIQTIMEMDCMPAGMELFPAVDQEQFDFIKTVIDDSDYYVIIIGGRYGSLNQDGVSYTEAEYDYAVSKGIKVVALVHSDPDSLPAAKSELSDKLRQQLVDFREKLMTGRLVRKWSNAHELPGLVSLSLQKTIKTYPAIGWVRGDQIADIASLKRIRDLMVENSKLSAENAQIKAMAAPIVPSNVAGGDTEYTFEVEYKANGGYSIKENISRTWGDIFDLIGFKVQIPASYIFAKKYLQDALSEEFGWRSCVIPDKTFETIGIQLKALGMIDVYVGNSKEGSRKIWWKTTISGMNYISERRIQKK